MLHKGDEDTWSTMLKRYQAETNAQEKSKLLRGLAWIDQPWIVHRFLTLAKNESIVRSQDYMICLRYIAQNPIGIYELTFYTDILTRKVDMQFFCFHIFKT